MLVRERASMLVRCHNGGGHERYHLGLVGTSVCVLLVCMKALSHAAAMGGH